MAVACDNYTDSRMTDHPLILLFILTSPKNASNVCYSDTSHGSYLRVAPMTRLWSGYYPGTAIIRATAINR